VAFIRSSKECKQLHCRNLAESGKQPKVQQVRVVSDLLLIMTGARTDMSPNRQKTAHPEITPEVEIKNMKSLLFILLVLCIFCAVGASGQVSGVLNAQPQMFEMPSHPQQASQQGMGQSHDIMGYP